MTPRKKTSKKKSTRGRRESDPVDETTEGADDLGAVLEELGTDGVTIQLHRRANDAAGAAERYGYVTTYAAEDLAPGTFFERVKSEWGGGRYQARIFTGDRSKPVKMRNFTIDSAFNHAAAAPAGADPTAALVDMVRELRRDLEDMRRAPAGGGADTMKTAIEIAGLMQSGQAETTKLLVELAKGDRSKPTAAGEMISGMRDMLGLAKEIQGGDGGKESYPFEGVITHFGKPLLEKLGEIADNERTHTNVPARPQVAPGQPETEVHTMTDAERAAAAQFPAWIHNVAPWVPQLLELAEKKSDAELWAAVVIEQSEEPQLGVMADALQGDAGAQQFYSAFPQCVPHREWFDTFFEKLEAQLFEPEPDACGIAGCILEVGHDGEHQPAPASGGAGAPPGASPAPASPDGG